jgi:hypothetical protein
MTGKAKRARGTLQFKLKAVRLVEAGITMAAAGAVQRRETVAHD